MEVAVSKLAELLELGVFDWIVLDDIDDVHEDFAEAIADVRVEIAAAHGVAPMQLTWHMATDGSLEAYCRVDLRPPQR
jgi:hypothetical protein